MITSKHIFMKITYFSIFHQTFTTIFLNGNNGVYECIWLIACDDITINNVAKNVAVLIFNELHSFCLNFSCSGSVAKCINM